MSVKLEILRTETANTYTTTALASTVTFAEYSVDGEVKTMTAADGCALVLVVDGVQQDLLSGKTYEAEDSFTVREVKVYRIGGPSAAPWSGAKEEEKATYWFRQALLVDGGKIVADGSVTEAIVGGEYDEKHADGITLNANGTHFNGILLDNGTKYTITGATFLAHGDGGDDLAGWGTSVMADNRSELEIANSYFELDGAIRCALYVDNASIADVHDTVIYTKETQDTCAEFANLTPGMMKRVPFALGMEGTVRSLNVMADGQGKFRNCIVVSTGWGALSTDSGTAYDECHTYALDAEDTLSGIGTMEVAQEGKEYTATKTVNGVTYGFTVNGSGYVTYADSGVHNRYKNVEFYSPDYIQVMGSGPSGSDYIDSYLLSGHTTFMTQQSRGGTFNLLNTKVDTVDALMQIKSGAANTGFSHLVVDDCQINFSGTSARAKDGILVELIESDDAGNPGITTYTICDTPAEAEATSSSVADSSATFKNGTYFGDICNSIYNYRQTLKVTLENATLTGTVSATQAVHVDMEGNVVPNGTVLNAFMGSEEFDHADYSAEKGGFSGECKLIGHFRHTAAPVLNNFIDLTMTKSAWNITGEGWINALSVDSLEDLAADQAVTVHVKALTVGGEVYADGIYTTGNVTVEVDSTVIEVKDNGVADSGQTYGNVKYAIISVMEDGSFNSKAFTVRRQNYVDGNLYFTIQPAEGYRVVNVTAEGGTLDKNTAGGEVAAYEQVVVPVLGNKEMSVTVTVGC
ncbi:MAG: hypothetical protein IKV99_02980 [Oscillospiraceae bacterium]|nr:hypothetical protein [Oscillospiraceae bacterium]